MKEKIAIVLMTTSLVLSMGAVASAENYSVSAAVVVQKW